MKIGDIERELDQARNDGPLSNIVIQPCPELLMALQRETRKLDPDPAEIARIASSDVAMAAALLRIANSPLYARARPANTVGEAVTMLGMGQAVAILTGFITRRAIPATSPLLAHFWETSTRRSLAMAFIARQLYGMNPEVAQTCGLFMHVGIPVMLQGLRGYAETLTEAMAQEDRSFTDIENTRHRTDHAVIGAIVAKTWHLPPVVAIGVRLHHDFTILSDQAMPAELRCLVAVAALAEHMVADYEGVQSQPEWERYGADCLSCLQIGQAEVDHWVDELHPVFEGVLLG